MTQSLVKVLQNSRAEWYWVMVGPDGVTVESSAEQYPTRAEAVAKAGARFEGENVGMMVDGITRGVDEERISLPRINARVERERAGVPG